MVLLVDSFQERVAESSPSSGAFNLRTARATASYILAINMTGVEGYPGPVFNEGSLVQPADLINLTPLILGGLFTTDVGDGRLNRILPLSHPQFPWLYASSYNARGIGSPAFTPSITPLEATPMPGYAIYPTYEITIEFENRNYAVLSDDSIEVMAVGWTDVDDATEVNDFAMEWLRFTDYQAQPQNDWVTCSIGNGFIFVTEGGTGLAASDPNGSVYAGMPRILLPNEVIKMVWHQVPYRYYSSANSYLRRFRGRINWRGWYDWDEGELLYINCNPVRYTPPILQPINWFQGALTLEKWCDMELYFVATRRDGVNVPTPTNANFIAAGHNLMPWHADNQFYYAQNVNTKFPTFPAFPFELLFTDPDFANPLDQGDAGDPEDIPPDDIEPDD